MPRHPDIHFGPAPDLAKITARVFTHQLRTHYDHIALESNGPRLSHVSWSTVSLQIYRINGSRRLSFPRPSKRDRCCAARGARNMFDVAIDKFGRWAVHSFGIAIRYSENVSGKYIYNCKLRPRDPSKPEEGSCAAVSARPRQLEIDERGKVEHMLRDLNTEDFMAGGRSPPLTIEAPPRETSLMDSLRKSATGALVGDKGNYCIQPSTCSSSQQKPGTSSSPL
ncbi:hypothetical protein F4775DRAFT_607987 [Biscogniauxia sp. FL1348]|nr:hypothetical protein F4775DRAFT_607987 [Biscogniauxia sp. FL1348]